ncbi:DUF4399 domain-containing protein [Azospirillum picis]|uniref:DUF4399 domain-containing protein n=1 Tax=Azospirillum picis TaxID=488438 RepID=A0ABU0MQX2_9PROT|nr:DUF4399 domain-containing protein [Azospirillum picis]MBP2302116.1 hypothetical protein [Azospirillum picis]MDQ0535593.1 hypothetical protein [Azospirillum picis]
MKSTIAQSAISPAAVVAVMLLALACGRPAAAAGEAPQQAGHDHHDASGDPARPAAGTDGPRRTPGNKDAWLYIGWPNNGEVVGTRFKVWFGLRNFGVAPAGVRRENTGHHHLLIDTDLKSFDEPIPSDKQHLHFGKGQTETVLDLPPGRHTLQLVLADADHVPHDPPIMSKKITITVRADRGSQQLSAR